MVERGEDGERVRFVVCNNFRQVELLCAEETARPWTVVGSTFAFATPRTWQGHVSGAFDVIQVTPRAFEAHCHAEGLRTPPHSIRAERARLLLRHGASVTQAAAAYDFTDQSHFARHFRRIWRISPGDYARQCNGGRLPRK